MSAQVITPLAALEVALGDRAYPIHIGTGLIDEADAFAASVRGPRAAVITNDVVAPLYLSRVRATLERAGKRATAIVLPDGESHKTLATLDRICGELLAAGCDRDTTLVALGGGVIGDMTGFAAATFMRGIPFVQVPTTLLAQVDSSVGGKTAVNHALGKNMIGAFHQPVAVLADLDTLDTLPDRELSAGLAEVIKHGAILDEAYFAWIETSMPALLGRERSALAHAVRRSCEIKAEVVRLDEREAGVRALLNFGHTFGHAIEAGLGYGAWLHGEAVGAGMILAARLSQRLGRLSAGDSVRLADAVGAARLRVDPPRLGVDRWIELMAHDKKAQAGSIRYVLLDRIGGASVGRADDAIVRAVIEQSGG